MNSIVLRRRPPKDVAEENVFMKDVAAVDADEPDPGLPFTIETVPDLSDAQAADLRRDPDTEDIISSMGFTLIAPLEDSGTEPSAADNAWGIAAVGADTSPHEGKGVTVAILDTGIDKDHAAFKGLLQNDDLMDFYDE